MSTLETLLNTSGGHKDIKEEDKQKLVKDEVEDDSGRYVTTNKKIKIQMEDRDNWYSHSANYWKEVPSTVDGMLGGYGDLTFADLSTSAEFLAPLVKEGMSTQLVVDCGAGIGRISKGLLLNVFDKVEMVDTCSEHLESAKQYMGPMFERVSAQHCTGLENFEPPEQHYDCVWIQWVIIYLSDYDFISLLARFKKSLKPGGYIVIKDNICRTGCEMDNNDGSITRSDYQLKKIFQKAGLELIKENVQKDFPKNLYKVKFYALR